MPYGDIVGHVKYLIDRHIGGTIEREQYALSKDGGAMFGELGVQIGETDLLSFAFRGSYNQTVSAALAAGKHVMVCDNLQIQGSALRVCRKNTTNSWEDFQALSTSHVQSALGHYQQMQLADDNMKALPITDRRGYAILGVAQGEGVLTPTQASVAFKDWKGVLEGNPRHEEFGEQNLWGLYQCVTEGLKKGAPVRRIERQTKAQDFFEGWL